MRFIVDKIPENHVACPFRSSDGTCLLNTEIEPSISDKVYPIPVTDVPGTAFLHVPVRPLRRRAKQCYGVIIDKNGKSVECANCISIGAYISKVFTPSHKQIDF